MGENKYKKEANTFKPTSSQDTAPVDLEFERMLKSFLKQVQKEGKLDLLKKRRYYVKPSELKRMKAKEKNRRKR